jgi:hypothetical protein
MFEAHAVNEGKVGYTPITSITQLITYQKFLGSMVSALYRQAKKTTPIRSDDKLVKSMTVTELQHKFNMELTAIQHRADYDIRQLTAAKADSHDQNEVMQVNSRIEDRKTTSQIEQTELRNRYNTLIDKRQQIDNTRLLCTARMSEHTGNQRKQQQQPQQQQQQQQQSNRLRLSNGSSNDDSSADIRMDTPLTSSMLYNMDSNTLSLSQSVASAAAVGHSMYDHHHSQQHEQQQQYQQQEHKRRRVNSPSITLSNSTDSIGYSNSSESAAAAAAAAKSARKSGTNIVVTALPGHSYSGSANTLIGLPMTSSSSNNSSTLYSITAAANAVEQSNLNNNSSSGIMNMFNSSNGGSNNSSNSNPMALNVNDTASVGTSTSSMPGFTDHTQT